MMKMLVTAMIDHNNADLYRPGDDLWFCPFKRSVLTGLQTIHHLASAARISKTHPRIYDRGDDDEVVHDHDSDGGGDDDGDGDETYDDYQSHFPMKSTQKCVKQVLEMLAHLKT